MTKQWDRAIAVLEQDCKTRHRYIRKVKTKAGIVEYTCAIGALALEAGVSKETLYAAGGRAITAESYNYEVTPPDTAAVITIRNAIEKEFGLDKWDQYSLQDENDAHERAKERRYSVVDVAKLLLQMQSK